MKKIISSFLIVTLLAALAVMPAQAATDVVINASDQSYTELVGTYDATYKAFIFGSAGQYVNYDVEIPSNAYYTLGLHTSSYGMSHAADQVFDIYIDGEKVGTHTLKNEDRVKWPTYNWYDAVEYPLTKGTHTLKLVFVSGYPYLKTVRFNAKEAFDAAEVVLNEESGTMDLPYTGYYQAVAKISSEAASETQKAKLLIDGSNKASGTVNSSTNEMRFNIMMLTEGSHRVELQKLSQDYNVEKLTFTYLGITENMKQYVEAEGVVQSTDEAESIVFNASEQNYINLDGARYEETYKAFLFSANGQSVSYEVDIPSKGDYTVGIHTASYGMSHTADQVFDIYVDGTKVGTHTLNNADRVAWPTYTWYDAVICPMTQGKHTVKIVFISGFPYMKTVKVEKFKPVAELEGNGGFVMNTKQYGELDYEIYAPESGSYELSAVIEECNYYALSIEGEFGEIYKVYRRSASETTALGAYRTVDLGKLDLAKGINQVKITNIAEPSTSNLAHGDVKIDKFVLLFEKQLGATDESVAATTYSKLSGASVSGGKVNLYTGDYAVYDFLVPESGYYKLTVNGNPSGNALVKVTADGAGSAKTLFRDADTRSTAIIELEKGKTRLTVDCDGEIALDSFALVGPLGITQDESRAFASKINGARDGAQVKEILTAAQNQLYIDVADATSGILYDAPVFNGMLKKNFGNIADVASGFSQLAFNNLISPDVVLFDESGKRIETLKNGNLTIKADTSSMNSKGYIFAALYKNDSLMSVETGVLEDTISRVELENVDVSEGVWKLRLFSIDGFEKMIPLAMFTNETIICVSTNGNDETGDGSREKPFATIGRAQRLARTKVWEAPGDVVISIDEGVYKITEPLKFSSEDSGRGGKVIYRGAENGKTIISGGTKIEGWQQTDVPEIYVADASDVTDTRTLYVNGYPAQRARSKYLYEALDYYYAEGSEYADDGLTVSTNNFPVITNNPENVEVVWRMLWCHHRTPVENIVRNSDNTYSIIMDQPYWDWARTSLSNYTKPIVDYIGTSPREQQTAKRTFYLENALELLDEPGEFYFDKDEKRIYYYPFGEENLTSSETEVYAGTTEMLVEAKGESKENKLKNLVFENLTFMHGAWNDVSRTGKRTSQADKFVSGSNQLSEVSGGYMVPPQVRFEFADNIEILGCEFACLGSGALGFIDGVTNSKVEGNVFRDISGTGLIISSWDNGKYLKATTEKRSNIEVKSNVCRRTANEFTDTCGMSIYYADNVTVTNNVFKDLPYTGITAGWGWSTNADSPEIGCKNIVIGHNSFENVMQLTSDGGAVYTLGNMHDSEVSNNYINGATYGNGGIYFDNGSAYETAKDNVVLNVPKWLKKNVGGYHDKAVNNFTNMDKTLDVDNYSLTEIDVQNTVYLTEDTISQYPKAVSIMENAGLTSEFESLADGLDLPAWRTDFMKPGNEPWYRYVGENSWVDMGNWTNFHDNNGAEPKWYKTILYEFADCVEFTTGDWVEYQVYIPKDGKYTLTYEAGHPVKPILSILNPKIRFYVDGTKKVEQRVPTTVEGQYVTGVFDGGTVNLTKGVHTIRVESPDRPMMIGPFRFHDGAERTENDALFDEGVIVK